MQQQPNGVVDVSRCAEHTDQILNYFCNICKCVACSVCVNDGRHTGHDVHLLSAICKQQKVNIAPVAAHLATKISSLPACSLCAAVVH